MNRIAGFFSSQTGSVAVAQKVFSKLSLDGLHRSEGLCELEPQFKHVYFMAYTVVEFCCSLAPLGPVGVATPKPTVANEGTALWNP